MSSRKRSVVAWVAAAVLAIAGASFAYLFWFAGGSGEPSTELTTPELAATTSTSLPTETTDEASPSTTGDTVVGSGSLTFVIDPSQSTARFELDEVLNGSPKHVIGTTDQVAGQVRVDTANLSSAEFSDIVVNARTLTTDSERRDRAIRGPIVLDSASDANELITFTVTAVDGLEGAAQIGDTIGFSITGDLTVKGVTQEVTFDATVTFVDPGTIQGSATAEIAREAFGIGIPSVPSVADVTDEVLIGIEFVALAD
ncbi:MAG TPA: YceI family protein [Acidimicrobiia bacterium]|nr:YceI family protein [Acidimicrobiia bacterium]